MLSLQTGTYLSTVYIQVTGGNKGIGYAVAEGLCKRFDGDVYLTARDSKRGQEAVEKLKTLGYNPIFHQLDITDQNSVDIFKDCLKTKYGGLDVLINNAAIAFQANATEPIAIQAEESIRVNYYGTLRVCNALFPLLRQDGRVVNVSSSAGHLVHIDSETLKEKFSDKNITVDELNKLMDKFVQDAKDDKHEDEGWGSDVHVAYCVSKVGICCLSFIQQRIFDVEVPNRNISVNSVHPGYIETDMTTVIRSHLPGAKSIQEGAKAILFLALEATLKGKYVWNDCEVVDWDILSGKLKDWISSLRKNHLHSQLVAKDHKMTE